MAIEKSGPLTITETVTLWDNGLVVPVMLAVPVNVTGNVPAWEAVRVQLGEVPVLPLLVKLIREGKQDAVIPLPVGTVSVRLICPKKALSAGTLEKIRPTPPIEPRSIVMDAGAVMIKSATDIFRIMEWVIP